MDVLELRNVIAGVLEHNGAKIFDAGMNLEPPEGELHLELAGKEYVVLVKERSK